MNIAQVNQQHAEVLSILRSDENVRFWAGRVMAAKGRVGYQRDDAKRGLFAAIYLALPEQATGLIPARNVMHSLSNAACGAFTYQDKGVMIESQGYLLADVVA